MREVLEKINSKIPGDYIFIFEGSGMPISSLTVD